MSKDENTYREGNTYVYIREDRDKWLALSHAMGRDIPHYRYYIDTGHGDTVQLDALLKTASAGDTIIVGNITDFADTNLNEMLNILENFNDLDVKIESRKQSDYAIETYRYLIRLAIEFSKFELTLMKSADNKNGRVAKCKFPKIALSES